MTQYEVTEVAVRVRFDDSLTGRRDLMRGFTFADGDKVAVALGAAEIKRLVQQGYLKVVGLRSGLERGTAIPQHNRLPTEVDMADPEGTRVKRVMHGPSETQRPTPQLELPPRDPSLPTQARVHDVPPEPAKAAKVSVLMPGTPVGKWDLDPARVADLELPALNALIQDRDPSVPTFGSGEEADARAFLTADFRATGSPVKRALPSASGSASVEDADRIVMAK